MRLLQIFAPLCCLTVNLTASVSARGLGSLQSRITGSSPTNLTLFDADSSANVSFPTGSQLNETHPSQINFVDGDFTVNYVREDIDLTPSAGRPVIGIYKFIIFVEHYITSAGWPVRRSIVFYQNDSRLIWTHKGGVYSKSRALELLSMLSRRLADLTRTYVGVMHIVDRRVPVQGLEFAWMKVLVRQSVRECANGRLRYNLALYPGDRIRLAAALNVTDTVSEWIRENKRPSDTVPTGTRLGTTLIQGFGAQFLMSFPLSEAPAQTDMTYQDIMLFLSDLQTALREGRTEVRGETGVAEIQLHTLRQTPSGPVTQGRVLVQLRTTSQLINTDGALPGPITA